MAFEILVSQSAKVELEALRVFDRRRILQAIETQLRHEPLSASRNRKKLEALIPGFEHCQPVWELRVGDYRVFYDADTDGQTVSVRAVRRKDPSQTTEDVAT